MPTQLLAFGPEKPLLNQASFVAKQGPFGSYAPAGDCQLGSINFPTSQKLSGKQRQHDVCKRRQRGVCKQCPFVKASSMASKVALPHDSRRYACPIPETYVADCDAVLASAQAYCTITTSMQVQLSVSCCKDAKLHLERVVCMPCHTCCDSTHALLLQIADWWNCKTVLAIHTAQKQIETAASACQCAPHCSEANLGCSISLPMCSHYICFCCLSFGPCVSAAMIP